MTPLVWLLAGTFVVDLVIVAFIALRLEARRRHDRREVRELEVLFEAPPAIVPEKVRSSGPRLHEWDDAVGYGPRRARTARSASFVLIVATIAAVIVAALMSPGQRVATRGAPLEDTLARRPVLGPRFDPSEPTGALHSGLSPAPEEQDGNDVRTVAGGNVAHSDGEVAVPETVAAQSASATSILLAWTPVPGATGYGIDRWVGSQPSGSSGWMRIAKKAPGVSTHRDTDLEASTTYYYRVTAQLEEGEAPASDVVSATTAPPAAPNLTAASDGGVVLLEWGDVEGEIGFQVERSTNDGSDWTVIATTEAGVISLTDGNVTPGASYLYRVLARGHGSDSSFSNIVPVSVAVPAEETPAPDVSEVDPVAIDPNASPGT